MLKACLPRGVCQKSVGVHKRSYRRELKAGERQRARIASSKGGKDICASVDSGSKWKARETVKEAWDKRPCDQRNKDCLFFQPRPRLDCPADSLIFQAKEIELSTVMPEGPWSLGWGCGTYRAIDMS